MFCGAENCIKLPLHIKSKSNQLMWKLGYWIDGWMDWYFGHYIFFLRHSSYRCVCLICVLWASCFSDMSPSRWGTTSSPLCQISIIAWRSTCLPQMNASHDDIMNSEIHCSRNSLLIRLTISVLSDISVFISKHLPIMWVWNVWVGM